MDNVSKVEAALKTFRERHNSSADDVVASAACTNVVQTSRNISLSNSVHVQRMGLNEQPKFGLMEEFDQYALYCDLAKKRAALDNEADIGQSSDIVAEKDGTEEVVKGTTSGRQDVTEVDDLRTNSSIVLDIIQKYGTNEEGGSDWEDENEEAMSSDDEEYLFPTPDEIGNAKPPEEGMLFNTLEEAVRFVNVFGKLSGFAVIKGRNHRHTKITLQCNKARNTRAKTTVQRKRKRNALKRTDCKMNVVVKLEDTKWRVVSCNLQHNHDLVSSPSLTKFFLSHRTMTDEEILLSKLLQEIRVKPQRIMTIFRRMKGSFGNVMFGKKKIDNLKQADRKLKMNTDIACTLKYMEKIQLEKPGFCCKMQVDSEGSVRSIFWTDARSRLDYSLYGEIICFDTTYSTNKYNMPFAPIIGINGHAKTIVFGWALLKNQQTDTFQWLFESFVEVMGGKKPKLILTDQAKSIENAISLVFLEAIHRFCIWHILKNLKENMSAYMAEREGMEEEIIRLITQSLHVLEFETGWKEMVQTYGCAEHDHIKRMWETRQKFVGAYFKESFCPFTRSTGRSESFNSNFKDYIMRKDSIENFLKQYELFQENVIEIENEDRFESTQKTAQFWGQQPIERHAGSVYTRGIYLKFATELLNSTAFGVTEVIRDQVYELRKLINYAKPEYRRDMFTVCVNRSNMTFECECGKFDKDGILCCHILRLFTQFDVLDIPEDYIVPRWTVSFREKELLKQKKETISSFGTGTAENTLRYAMLMNSMNDVCADIRRDGQKSTIFMEEVLKLHKRLMVGDDDLNQNAITSSILKDPPVIKKGTSSKTNDSDMDKNRGMEPEKEPTGSSVNIWLKGDGSISASVEEGANKVKKKQKKQSKSRCAPKSSKTSQKDAVEDDGLVCKDPPVSSNKSVRKGNRMKPPSEKNSRKSKKKQQK